MQCAQALQFGHGGVAVGDGDGQGEEAALADVELGLDRAARVYVIGRTV